VDESGQVEVAERVVEMGPGSIRVGRFIGRLGVVAMPVIERGLGLVDRVVRRHVARLEKVGWCKRIPAIRGDGMLVWMTPSGLDGVGLGELPAPRAPDPFSPQTLRSIRVAWAAADIERAGHQWIAGRELALAPGRWGAQIPNERGGRSRRLPDLVFWPTSDGKLSVAVVVVQGRSNPRREGVALEGWQASITTGRYAQVRYLAGPADASHLGRLATEIGLTAPQFIAAERAVADEAPVLPSVIENVDEELVAVETAPGAEPDFPRPSPEHVVPQRSTTQEPVETSEQAAERRKLINDVLGHGEPARRRRWRLGAT
jgi:hypothetical protein